MESNTIFNIVLLEPEIPQNTGNIARTCAAAGCSLHLIKPLGFSVDDKHLKRAGLDYWNLLDITYYENYKDFIDRNPEGVKYFLTTKAEKNYCEITYPNGSFFIFGKESAGIPEELLVSNKDTCIRIPMKEEARSLNLSNAAAIIIYEALRQTGFNELTIEGKLHNLSW